MAYRPALRRPAMAQPPHRRTSTYVAGGIVLAIIVLALLWDWNWFKPLVEHEASSALGRSVTLQHFDVKMRWHPWFIADSIAIANRSEEHTSELQSLMRISYAVFCLTHKISNIQSDRY